MLRDATCRLSGILCLFIDLILILTCVALSPAAFLLNMLYEQPELFAHSRG
jgi:hypothetical protein